MDIYETSKERLFLSDSYIYKSVIYKLWPGGASLFEEKYYSSKTPIKFKKKDLKVKKKDYTLYRFFTLEGAPLEYLVNNGFKKVDDNEE